MSILKDLHPGDLFMIKNGRKLYAFKYEKSGLGAYWDRGKKHYTASLDKIVFKLST